MCSPLIQGKTDAGEESHLEIPVHPKLREIIDATTDVGHQTFLVTISASPTPRPVSATGFVNLRSGWMPGRVGAWLTQGDGNAARGYRMHRARNRGNHSATRRSRWCEIYTRAANRKRKARDGHAQAC